MSKKLPVRYRCARGSGRRRTKYDALRVERVKCIRIRVYDGDGG